MYNLQQHFSFLGVGNMHVLGSVLEGFSVDQKENLKKKMKHCSKKKCIQEIVENALLLWSIKNVKEVYFEGKKVNFGTFMV